MLQGRVLKPKWSFLSLRTVVLFNFALIFGIYLYGLFTDEPYWREIGHSPDLYDYLLWAGLVLNGPAGFVANRIAEFVPPNIYNDEQRFSVEFGFWLLLLWPQWKSYDLLAQWCIRDRRRATALYLVIASITAVACAVTYKTYFAPYEIWHPLYVDHIFPIVCAFCVILSGMFIIAYLELSRRAYLRGSPFASPA